MTARQIARKLAGFVNAETVVLIDDAPDPSVPCLIRCRRDEVEVSVVDADGDPEPEKTDALYDRVARVLGFADAHKTGYGAWIGCPTAPVRYRHD